MPEKGCTGRHTCNHNGDVEFDDTGDLSVQPMHSQPVHSHQGTGTADLLEMYNPPRIPQRIRAFGKLDLKHQVEYTRYTSPAPSNTSTSIHQIAPRQKKNETLTQTPS